METILRHIGTVHAHDPNFYLQCVVDGCPRTYTNYSSFRKHLRLKHCEHLIAAPSIPESDFEERGNEMIDLNEASIFEDEHLKLRSSALFLLKAKEVYRLTQWSLNNVMEEVRTIVQQTLREVERQVLLNLSANGMEINEMIGLREIFHDQELCEPFKSLRTEYLQQTVYKQLFQLVVSIILINLE